MSSCTHSVVPETGVLFGTGDFKGPGREIFVRSLEGLNRSFHSLISCASEDEEPPTEALLLRKDLRATLLHQKPPSLDTVVVGPERAQ